MKTLASIVLVTAMGIATASAQPGRGDGQGFKGDRGGDGRPRIDRITDALNLDAEPTSQLEALRDQFRLEMVDLRANVQKARLEVRRLLRQDTVDQAAVMKAVEAESQAQLALRKSTVAHQIKVREIVGPENADKLMELRNERRDQRPGPDGGNRDDRGPKGKR